MTKTPAHLSVTIWVFSFFFQCNFSLTSQYDKETYFLKQQMKRLYWNYALLRLRYKRRICKGIKMLIKQAGCKSCFKPHEICMALCEPYAERIAHWHATERNRDHFMLCWESVVLTPDTNAQPSPPCMKSQLLNVASMNKKFREISSHTICHLSNSKACVH